MLKGCLTSPSWRDSEPTAEQPKNSCFPPYVPHQDALNTSILGDLKATPMFGNVHGSTVLRGSVGWNLGLIEDARSQPQ